MRSEQDAPRASHDLTRDVLPAPVPLIKVRGVSRLNRKAELTVINRIHVRGQE